jgi:hypothetical protein
MGSGNRRVVCNEWKFGFMLVHPLLLEKHKSLSGAFWIIQSLFLVSSKLQR